MGRTTRSRTAPHNRTLGLGQRERLREDEAGERHRLVRVTRPVHLMKSVKCNHCHAWIACRVRWQDIAGRIDAATKNDASASACVYSSLRCSSQSQAQPDTRRMHSTKPSIGWMPHHHVVLNSSSCANLQDSSCTRSRQCSGLPNQRPRRTEQTLKPGGNANWKNLETQSDGRVYARQR